MKTTDLRTAAQQALWALEYHVEMTWPIDRTSEAIFNLRAALAQPQIDPVDEYRKGFIAGQIDMRDREPPAPETVAVQEQDIEDAIEAAYWHFDARKKGLNEWASAPQSERDAFKAEARKLVRGYFPTRQAQDTKREMLAVADAFIRGKRAALAQQEEPVATLIAQRDALLEALKRIESAVDWYLGRSSFTQTTQLKGLGHSASVRKELFAAHDETRAAIKAVEGEKK